GRVGPERTPQRHHDRLLGVDRAAQLGEHRRGGGGGQGESGVAEPVLVEHAVLGDLGVASAGLDAHDPALQLVHVVGQLVDRGDVGVLRHCEGELRVVVVGAQVLELVPVLLHVLGVGDLRPGRRVDVHVALGKGGVEHPRLAELLVLHGVAGLGQEVVQQVRGAQTVRPGRDVAERDRVTTTVTTVTTVAAVTTITTGVAAARGEGQADGTGSEQSGHLTATQGCAGGLHRNSYSHVVPYRSQCAPWRAFSVSAGALSCSAASAFAFRTAALRLPRITLINEPLFSWPTAAVIRSRKIARITMPRPASKPRETFTVDSAETTVLPSPGAPTNPAITAMDRPSMMTW